MVIAVVTHPADAASAALARRWHAHDARLLTSADLSSPGWLVSNQGEEAAMVVVGGEPVPADQIAGVLVRTPAIGSAELGVIVLEDRDYCAAEMTAFLTWWLTGLPAPVINRPTALSLAGPGWRPATWHIVAQRAGLRSAAPRWRAERQHDHYAGAGSSRRQPPDGMRIEVVTVVDHRPIGTADALLAQQAVALARAAAAEALAVAFDTGSDPPGFLWAEPWVNIADPAVADALLESLLRRGPHPAGAP
jgi:hypothetical protein